jgi:hypothetical protein
MKQTFSNFNNITYFLDPFPHLPMHSKIRPIVRGWQLQQCMQFADPFGRLMGTVLTHTSIVVVLRLTTYNSFVWEQMRSLNDVCIIDYSLSSNTKRLP